nr:hypothetical protein [uncultured bacterium]
MLLFCCIRELDDLVILNHFLRKVLINLMRKASFNTAC